MKNNILRFITEAWLWALIVLLLAMAKVRGADFTIGWQHPETVRYIFEGRTNQGGTLQPGGAAERFIIRMQHNDFPTVDVPLTNIIGLFFEGTSTNRYGHTTTNFFRHTFTNLPSGNWRFQIEAMSWAGHISGTNTPLTITTNPPAAPIFQQIIVRLP